MATRQLQYIPIDDYPVSSLYKKKLKKRQRDAVRQTKHHGYRKPKELFEALAATISDPAKNIGNQDPGLLCNPFLVRAAMEGGAAEISREVNEYEDLPVTSERIIMDNDPDYDPEDEQDEGDDIDSRNFLYQAAQMRPTAPDVKRGFLFGRRGPSKRKATSDLPSATERATKRGTQSRSQGPKQPAEPDDEDVHLEEEQPDESTYRTVARRTGKFVNLMTSTGEMGSKSINLLYRGVTRGLMGGEVSRRVVYLSLMSMMYAGHRVYQNPTAANAAKVLMSFDKEPVSDTQKQAEMYSVVDALVPNNVAANFETTIRESENFNPTTHWMRNAMGRDVAEMASKAGAPKFLTTNIQYAHDLFDEPLTLRYQGWSSIGKSVSRNVKGLPGALAKYGDYMQAASVGGFLGRTTFASNFQGALRWVGDETLGRLADAGERWSPATAAWWEQTASQNDIELRAKRGKVALSRGMLGTYAALTHPFNAPKKEWGYASMMGKGMSTAVRDIWQGKKDVRLNPTYVIDSNTGDTVPIDQMQQQGDAPDPWVPELEQADDGYTDNLGAPAIETETLIQDMVKEAVEEEPQQQPGAIAQEEEEAHQRDGMNLNDGTEVEQSYNQMEQRAEQAQDVAYHERTDEDFREQLGDEANAAWLEYQDLYEKAAETAVDKVNILGEMTSVSKVNEATFESFLDGIADVADALDENDPKHATLKYQLGERLDHLMQAHENLREEKRGTREKGKPKFEVRSIRNQLQYIQAGQPLRKVGPSGELLQEPLGR